ncbi:hypothetical protein TNCV_316771 [Trichonephila clavipes]|nr:hypothetical protein TNCV_316771 [Trichonephila clavipes]
MSSVYVQQVGYGDTDPCIWCVWLGVRHCGTVTTESFDSLILVIKVSDSWPACHEFKPGTTEEGRCTLRMSRLKCPPIGVEVRRGGAGSGVVLFP